MKIFVIIAAALLLGYIGFDRYQHFRNEKNAAREKAELAALEERRRSELAARVAAEEKKRQAEEEELIAAENRLRAAEKQLREDSDAEKKRKAAQELLARKRQAKQLLIDQKKKELKRLVDQCSDIQKQISGNTAASLRNIAQRRQYLLRAISSEEQRAKDLYRQLVNRQKNARLMQCFAHCVLRHHIDCRVQMSNESKKTLHGTYFKICPIPSHRRTKRNRSCKYYDKNGYWFVRFVCEEHRNSWTKEKIAEFKKIYELRRDEFVGTTARRQLSAQLQSIARKRKELKQLQTRSTSSRRVQLLRQQYKKLNDQISAIQKDISALQKEINEIR